MSYVAKRFQNTSGSLTLDVDAIRKYPDLIDLSIGDTDFITDRRIIDAAHRDALAGATRYGFPKGDPELITAICRAWAEDFGQEVPESEVVVTASSCLGMQVALLSILNPGDEVIVLAPYFDVYRHQIQLAGGVCVEVPGSEANRWRLDEDALRAAVTDRTRAIIFNNPCNPTGAAYTLRDMQLLAELSEAHDLLILADEIYTRYLYEGTFVPLRTLPGMTERTVTLNSFSKNFMMTGWRVGYVIAPEEIARAILAINGNMIYTTPAPSQRAAIEALRLREDIQRLYISQYKERVFYAADRIEKIPYMTLARPKGTFYLFPGIQRTGLTSEDFCKAAVERAHVLLSPGSAFGKAGAGHVRIACTVGVDRLKDAFDRLEALTFE